MHVLKGAMRDGAMIEGSWWKDLQHKEIMTTNCGTRKMHNKWSWHNKKIVAKGMQNGYGELVDKLP